MDIQDVYDAIVNGDVDGNFDAIYEAIKQRRKVLVNRNALNLTNGTIVKLVDVRPKYLAGMQGTIIGGDRSKFIVLLDEQYRLKARNYAKDGELRCSAGMLEVIANAHE